MIASMHATMLDEWFGMAMWACHTRFLTVVRAVATSFQNCVLTHVNSGCAEMMCCHQVRSSLTIGDRSLSLI